MHNGLDFFAKCCKIVIMKRAQQDLIIKDLARKMVLLTGPRQVGKTSLALEIIKDFEKSVYLNYDSFEDRAIIHKTAWFPDTKFLVLDELHKMDGWKNYLKGLYDTKPANLKILVTGSARLDTFRASGDSLAGRFFRHRLNPLSPSEIQESSNTIIERFITRGGFPEPYLTDSEIDADRWRLQYIDGLIRTDILDFERVHDLRAIQLTLDLLRRRVGSPVSLSSLAEDVNCSPNTIKRYIEILEALFILFRVTPYHKNIARSLLKEPKIYFYDTGMVKGGNGHRFENMVAVCLLKHLNAIEDYEGRQAQLYYLRTKEKKEVDFALAVEDKPVVLIEAKISDQTISPSLKYFHRKYSLPAVQLVKDLKHEHIEDNIEIRRAGDYLRHLKM